MYACMRYKQGLHHRAHWSPSLLLTAIHPYRRGRGWARPCHCMNSLRHVRSRDRIRGRGQWWGSRCWTNCAAGSLRCSCATLSLWSAARLPSDRCVYMYTSVCVCVCASMCSPVHKRACARLLNARCESKCGWVIECTCVREIVCVCTPKQYSSLLSAFLDRLCTALASHNLFSQSSSTDEM